MLRRRPLEDEPTLLLCTSPVACQQSISLLSCSWKYGMFTELSWWVKMFIPHERPEAMDNSPWNRRLAQTCHLRVILPRQRWRFRNPLHISTMFQYYRSLCTVVTGSSCSRF